MLMLDEALGLELSKFSRQLKKKPTIDDNYQIVIDISKNLWLHENGKKGNEEQVTARLNPRETETHLDRNSAMVLRKKQRKTDGFT